MLTEDRLQELAEQFEEKFSAVSLRILRDIGETLKKTGDLTPAQAKKLQQMFTYGADIERMTKMLAQTAGESIDDIRKLYEQVAQEEQDWSKPFYDAKDIPQIPLKENELLQNIIKSATAVTKGDLRNMSRTTVVGIKGKDGFQPLGSFYKKTVDGAITAVATGTLDYNSAIRQAIKDMGSSGLRVRYEGGYTKRLDSAIRQNIIDGASYIAQETAKQAGEEFGADGVELSAHSPSAPDHLPYQGKQYSMKEFDELQKTLDRPIGEWNCRHFPYPILLGISRPANSKEELAQMQEESNRIIEIDGKEYTRYECTQIQRKLETKLRYAREEKAIYRAAGQDDLVREVTEKMRILGNKYKEVSEKAGLPTRAERLRLFKTSKERGDKISVVQAPISNHSIIMEKDRRILREVLDKSDGDETMVSRLILYNDATPWVYDETAKNAFAYNPTKDAIVYNPMHEFYDEYDMVYAQTHELTHRADYLEFESWKNPKFKKAIEVCQKRVYDKKEEVCKLVGIDGKYEADPAFSDIISALSNGDLNNHLVYFHGKGYWEKWENVSLEVFANISCIDVLGYPSKDEFRELLKEIYDVYKEVLK